LDIPQHHSWLKFKEWADQYGPIFRINIAGHEHYVVSTEKIANDLLRGRGTIYSSREQTPAAAQLLSGGLRPLLLPYNGNNLLESYSYISSHKIETWRSVRRIMHLFAMPSAAKGYQATQAMESVWLLENLIDSPERYMQHLERYSSGLIFRLAFGRRIATGAEEEVRRIYKVVHNLERIASPGAYMVDTFPSLMKLPEVIAPFKRELKGLHEEELSLFRKLRDDVLAHPNSTDCWEKVAMEKREEFGLSDDELAYVVGTMFEAGSGTTGAAMMSFLLTMVLHPDAMVDLQTELDKVVGDDRLPVFDDILNLPITRATIKEVLRWRPVTAGGIPHLLTKDDIYEGFFIPAGTNIHANQWLVGTPSGCSENILIHHTGQSTEIRSSIQSPSDFFQNAGYHQITQPTRSH
jgi:cytochrome P450